jgi:hypothetical protein
MSNYLYFNVEYAVRTQDFIIKNSGGRFGMFDIEKIESVLGHIQNDFYYPEFEDKSGQKHQKKHFFDVKSFNIILKRNH